MTEGLSCYKHDICSSNDNCVIPSNKYQCPSSQTWCFKNDIIYDVAERGCAESYNCNASAPVPRRYCCNTDYCNDAILSIQISRSVLFISILIVNLILFFK